jgi:hypothetical protein
MEENNNENANAEEVTEPLTPEMLQGTLEQMMAYVGVIEPMLGLPQGTVMGALHGNPEAEASLRGKLEQLSSFVGSLQAPLTSATDKITGLAGAVFSFALGTLPAGSLDNFPNAVDESTGMLRILGEIGNFLQNVDALAAKMIGQSVDERAQHLVRIYVDGLDSMLTAGIESAVSMLANDMPPVIEE